MSFLVDISKKKGKKIYELTGYKSVITHKITETSLKKNKKKKLSLLPFFPAFFFNSSEN